MTVAGVGQGHVGLRVWAEPGRSQRAWLALDPPASVEDVEVSQVSDEVLRLRRLPPFLPDVPEHALHGRKELVTQTLAGPVHVETVGDRVHLGADARLARSWGGQDAVEDLVVYAPLGDEVLAGAVERAQGLHDLLRRRLVQQALAHVGQCFPVDQKVNDNTASKFSGIMSGL